MNRKLIAAAVGAALAAPGAALAAAELYGRVNLGVDQYSATGATAGSASDYKSRLRVFDSGSRLGVRGSEDLGGGLKAVYLIETGVNVDSGGLNGQSGTANTSSGWLASRIGMAGLAGDFGQVAFGRQNTWWGSGVNQPFQAAYINAAGQMDSGGFGRNMGPGVARVSNSVQYTSPKLGPVEIIATYSPQGENVGANLDGNGKITALTVQGASGPASYALDYAANDGNTPAAGSASKRTALKLRGGFAYQPGARISLVWVKVTAENVTGGGIAENNTALAQSGLQVNWEHTVGQINIMAQYQKIGNITGCATSANCADTNNTGMMLGVRYLHTKSTASYLTYNTYTNAANYNADYTSGGQSSVSGTVPNGVDPKIMAVGISHFF